MEADLSRSFWLLTGGHGLHTVHPMCCFVTVFSIFSRYSEPVLAVYCGNVLC